MRRLLTSILGLGLLSVLFVGCGGGDATGPEDTATIDMDPMVSPDPAPDAGPGVEMTPEEGPIDDLDTGEPAPATPGDA